MSADKIVYIITGLSGAGKSLASDCLEDHEFYCVDNLPPELMEQFAELAMTAKRERIAIVCDIRGGDKFEELFQALERLAKQGIRHYIIFLEAKDEILIRRFSETRRAHPLRGASIADCIQKERSLLEELRGNAAAIVDTSDLSPSQLRERITELVRGKLATASMNVVIQSFGYKYGVPIESDLVFDVRFLPNPHYVPSLNPLTGRDEAVREYIFKWEVSRRFHEELLRFTDFLLPHFDKEGKSNLTISIGCTGGKHRSVAIAEALWRHLEHHNFETLLRHRDMGRTGP